jgi:hypothetical protein
MWDFFANLWVARRYMVHRPRCLIYRNSFVTNHQHQHEMSLLRIR